MHVQVVTCTVQFILSFSNISPSYELVHVGYLYDCWLASAMCPATAGAAGWLPGIRNMIRKLQSASSTAAAWLCPLPSLPTAVDVVRGEVV